MKRVVVARRTALCAATACGVALSMVSFAPAAQTQSVSVLTAQYDNARTGANLHETTLTPQNVNGRTFGKVFTLRVEGDIYAQPLYAPQVDLGAKGKHNLLVVATEHDVVYGFDADGHGSDPLWQAKLADAAKGETPLPFQDTHCPFIRPEVGITPTPVIDAESGTVYVLARTKAHGAYAQWLHALDLGTGAERQGSPVEIKATAKRRVMGFQRDVPFDPLLENPRAALLLERGKLYLSWGSSCDVGNYHGWVMAYDARSLAQTAAFNTSPDDDQSGIWAGDTGPAADGAGNIFVATGNGRFDANSGGRDYGDTVVKLGADLAVRDYFTPSDQQQMNATDADLGSGNPVLLPESGGAHPHVLVVGGKDGKLYVVDRDRMGKFQPGKNPHAVQTLDFPGMLLGAAAYWNGHLLVWGSEDVLKDYAISNGMLSAQPVAKAAVKAPDPGATPAISANGMKNGIVWAIETKTWNGADRAAILHAFDAANVAHELWASSQDAARDQAGRALRFTIPTVANGRVYVGCKGEVEVYGLLRNH